MKTNQNSKKIGASVLLATAIMMSLSSCATSRAVDRGQINGKAVVNERMDAARTVQRTSSSFVVDNSFHAARTPLESTGNVRRTPLPLTFQKAADLNRLQPVSISELASHITKVSGYRVVISPDVVADGSSSLPEIMYSGSLAGLLDNTTGSMNLSWRWNSDRIEIFRYETKMFKINALAGTTDVNTTLDTTSTSSVASSGAGGGGQQGNEGSSGQRTTIASNFDLWTDVTNVLKGILSDKGRLTIASSAGTISVRDTPMVLSQVEAQVREFNRIYSRQVKLNVEVYAVENSASDNYGTDFQLAWGQAAGKYGIEYSNNGTGSTGSGPGLSAVINTGPFAGSRAIVQALTSIGNTTLLTSGSVSSLNGQSVPMNVSTEQAYLQSYSTTLTSGDAGNSTTTLTPGVVTGGFSMHFTPHVLEDSKVMLRYSIDLSSVDNIATFEAPDGNSAIQLPTRSVRNFMQNVNVKSGQTLVLTGFQQTSDNTNNSGPFSSKAWFLGGKKNATKSTKTIVIVVTPYIVE